MQIGDVNVVQVIFDYEVRLGILEKVIEFVVNNNSSLSKPSQSVIDRFRNESIAELQKKYPNMGIQPK